MLCPSFCLRLVSTFPFISLVSSIAFFFRPSSVSHSSVRSTLIDVSFLCSRCKPADVVKSCETKAAHLNKPFCHRVRSGCFSSHFGSNLGVRHCVQLVRGRHDVWIPLASSASCKASSAWFTCADTVNSDRNLKDVGEPSVTAGRSQQHFLGD